MRIGFIGSGRIGGTLARLAVNRGHEVVLSNSRGPATLRGLVADLGPLASAVTPDEAAACGDVVVVTIPLKAYPSVPVEPLSGTVVIDTSNHYPARGGRIPELVSMSWTRDRSGRDAGSSRTALPTTSASLLTSCGTPFSRRDPPERHRGPAVCGTGVISRWR